MIDKDSEQLYELKNLSRCLQMLEFNVKFMLDNVDWSDFSQEMFAVTKRLQIAVYEAKQKYIQEIRFNNSNLY